MDAAKKATTIRDAWLACELGPLSGPTQAWRMDLSEARGTKAHTRLETYLELRDPGRFVHSAFTGHRGCGKSTELLRLKQKWDKNLFVVYFEVTDLLDPNDIAFSDLFLAISMQLAQAFHDAEMPLDRRILKSVESFAASVIQETTNATKAQIEAGATVEAGGAIPFFGKLKAWITSQYKASTDHKQTIRRIFERDITRLITDTNLLLDDAREKLRRANRGQTDLLIILDNLDRIPPDVGEKLVFQHGDSLKQLRTNVIYTVPVSVLHSPKGLEHVFAKHDILPMVKVFRYSRRAKNLRWDAAGVAALVDALGHRVDIESVFESADLAADLADQVRHGERAGATLVNGLCQDRASHGLGRLDDLLRAVVSAVALLGVAEDPPHHLGVRFIPLLGVEHPADGEQRILGLDLQLGGLLGVGSLHAGYQFLAQIRGERLFV